MILLLGGVDDLNEAILLSGDALVLRPPGHPDRSMTLDGLANRLTTRYNLLGGVDDLNEAILLSRNALALRPRGHPDLFMSLNNLAVRLATRYDLLGGVDDLNEAILLSRKALALRPRGHPDRSTSLNNLAVHLATRYKLVGAYRAPFLDNLTYYFSIQLHDPEDHKKLFSFYSELTDVTRTVSLGDLSATKAWVNAAEDFRHSTTLPAYETALRLLVQHLTTFPSLPQHFAAIRSLASSLAADAFSADLRHQSSGKAVESFEQGQGIFWSRLICLLSMTSSNVVLREGRWRMSSDA